MNPEIVRLAMRPVPRYTSYPTALQFSPDVSSEDYGNWLDALPQDAPLSVYIHVPFCRQLCLYCGCHTRAERNEETLEGYAELLRGEIEIVSNVRRKPMRVVHLHWGGGTPTILGSRRLERVVDALRKSFMFDAGSEQAIELDPRHVDRSLARSLARLGFNRASLGVQTFDAAVQRAIGRIQPFDQVRRTVEYIREEGIDALSFDLMYGLPYQTVASVVETATVAAALRPQRISAFGYAHVPWLKKVQGGIDPATLPGLEERWAQRAAIRELLLGEGYVSVGFDHFATPDDSLARALAEGRLRRNFQGYTTDTALALIGFGASAIGRLPAGYVQNSADLRAYARAISDGRFPTSRGRAVSKDDRKRAALIEDILCYGTAYLDDEILRSLSRVATSRLQQLSRLGLTLMEGNKLTVTEAGWPLARLIASLFDAYRADDTNGKHSVAI